MKRREFIQKSIFGTTGLSLYSFSCQSKRERTVARRKLGNTGEELSVVGFGGILVRDEEQAAANYLVSQAVDYGINYFDVAPTYGNAEEKLGPALEPCRKNSFLACKTHKRDKQGAEAELHESLKKLRTDHFDLYQLHALSSNEDVEKVFGPDGAMEVFTKARKDGKVRFLGFSAHSEEAALLAMEKFDFDSVLFPINFVCWYNGNFGPRLVETAKKKNMGILALKGLAHTRVPKGEAKPFNKCWYQPIVQDRIADLSYRFTLSQSTTAAIPPGEQLFFWKAMEIENQFQPVSDAEKQELESLATEVQPIFSST